MKWIHFVFNNWNSITRQMSKIQWVQEITVSNILLCPHLLNFPWSTCCSRILLRSAYPFISLNRNDPWHRIKVGIYLGNGNHTCFQTIRCQNVLCLYFISIKCIFFFFSSPCQRQCELLPSLGVGRLLSVVR